MAQNSKRKDASDWHPEENNRNSSNIVKRPRLDPQNKTPTTALKNLNLRVARDPAAAEALVNALSQDESSKAAGLEMIGMRI